MVGTWTWPIETEVCGLQGQRSDRRRKAGKRLIGCAHAIG